MKSLTDLQKIFNEFDGDSKDEFIKKYPEIWNDCYDITEQSRYHRVMLKCLEAGFDACQTEMQQQLDDARLDFKRVDEMNSTLKQMVSKMKAALEFYENKRHPIYRGVALQTLAEVAEIEKGLG